MGFLKNGAIKSTTKKRFYALLGVIEENLNKNPGTDPMRILREYIDAVNVYQDMFNTAKGLTVLPSDRIEIPGDAQNWFELLRYLVVVMVNKELAYDRTMGTKDDRKLIVKTLDEEIEKWKNANQ